MWERARGPERSSNIHRAPGWEENGLSNKSKVVKEGRSAESREDNEPLNVRIAQKYLWKVLGTYRHSVNGTLVCFLDK